jgi:acetate kinase
MNVLVLNCGSSTVKFQLVATNLDLIARDADERRAGGQVERIGGGPSSLFRRRAESPCARRPLCATRARPSRRSSVG